MESCVFCKIVENKIPAHRIYEDVNFLAFLDINPISPGHALIIPKAHIRWVWDVEPFGEYAIIAQKIAQRQREVFGIEAVHAKVVGEEVPHAHIWIYPDPQAVFPDKYANKRDFEMLAKILKID